MITAKQAEHLSSDQRADIRYSWASPIGLARKYGVSVATIQLLRRTAVPGHPARIVARNARWSRVKKLQVPAVDVNPPKANTFAS